MTPEEEAIQEEAIAFAKANHKAIVKEVLADAVTGDEEPVSVFMAGAPGAGKTEASLGLLQELANDGITLFRLDPDELRAKFPAYTGANSSLFQRAVSKLVDKIHDQLLKHRVSFMMDGTLSSYDVAKSNIERSLKKGRLVRILFVYQKPELSWGFVQKREAVEGRNIPLEAFITQYFASRRVVNTLKTEFGDAIEVNVIVKNLDGSTPETAEVNVTSIDACVPEGYTEEGLRQMLITRGRV